MKCPRSATLAAAAAATLLSTLAGAQSAQPRATDSAFEATLYTGGPLPPGTHIERHGNGFVIAGGLAIFSAAYVPWAIAGAVWAEGLAVTVNLHRASIWRAIPIAGPIIMGIVYNDLQRADCERARASGMPTLASLDFCEEIVARMRDENDMPVVSNLRPQQADVAQWIWLASLAGIQVTGIVMAIIGIASERVVVPDSPRRTASRPVRFAITPGAEHAPVGLTLGVTHF